MAKKAAVKDIGEKDRDALDKKIEVEERKLRPPLKTILDTLHLRVPEKADVITKKFTASPGLLNHRRSTSRQLKRQEGEINKMSVHIWIERRRQYEEFKEQSNADSLDSKPEKSARGHDAADRGAPHLSLASDQSDIDRRASAEDGGRASDRRIPPLRGPRRVIKGAVIRS